MEYSKLHGWYLDCQVNLELIFGVPATELDEVSGDGYREQEYSYQEQQQGNDEEVDGYQECPDHAVEGEEGQDGNEPYGFPLIFGELVKFEVQVVLSALTLGYQYTIIRLQRETPSCQKQNGAYIPIGLCSRTVSSEVLDQPDNGTNHQNPSNDLDEDVNAPYERK